MRWGHSARDRALIAAYYVLLVLHKIRRPGWRLGSGMHPSFWLADVSVDTPVGRFRCRGRTTDFDIVNPNYEADLVRSLGTRLMMSKTSTTVFVDVGAHIGKYSVLAGLMLQDHGRILAIEPDPANFAQLEANLLLNRLVNVRPRNNGCWSEDGVRTLFRSPGNLGAHSFVAARGGGQIPVQVRTLDGLLHEEGMNEIDLIKLDVEGAELEVLRGARETLEANPHMTIFFEETGDPSRSKTIRFLRDLEFKTGHVSGITYVAERLRT